MENTFGAPNGYINSPHTINDDGRVNQVYQNDLQPIQDLPQRVEGRVQFEDNVNDERVAETIKGL